MHIAFFFLVHRSLQLFKRITVVLIKQSLRRKGSNQQRVRKLAAPRGLRGKVADGTHPETLWCRGTELYPQQTLFHLKSPFICNRVRDSPKSYRWSPAPPPVYQPLIPASNVPLNTRPELLGAPNVPPIHNSTVTIVQQPAGQSVYVQQQIFTPTQYVPPVTMTTTIDPYLLSQPSLPSLQVINVLVEAGMFLLTYSSNPPISLSQSRRQPLLSFLFFPQVVVQQPMPQLLPLPQPYPLKIIHSLVYQAVSNWCPSPLPLLCSLDLQTSYHLIGKRPQIHQERLVVWCRVVLVVFTRC